ncbi:MULTISPECIES: chemotaxis protein CheW [unclassified Janthinobacterium]|uniref:chemotaxis protein CheW n=1 Tax=unclassified Janthinobacterium TaxID=2610881 RepID=UPI00034545A5|nr:MULTISPECIES: chemotaxis protein CheW [unclassified Janthinobacterium]MEC5159647.1 twitching motility protein PilI [Janthinobacterium sp. CG_S6]
MAPPGHQPPPAAPDGAERRSRLRQYQVQLLERMQAAKSGAVDRSKQLGVLVGARHCLLDLTQVGEIVALAPIGAVPLARDWYLGLCNLRGNLTGVVDLARYRGEAACASGPDSRVVTFAPALGFNCALLAERVLGLRQSGQMQAQPDAAAAPAWAARHFVDADGQAWSMLDLALLVREARFLQVGF